MEPFKSFFVLVIVLAACGTASGQACGKYRLKYIGHISPNDYQVIQIKLPTTRLLHGYVTEDDPSAFITLDNQENDSINFQIASHLTSELYGNPNRYLELYRKVRIVFPLKLVIRTSNREKEKTIHIPWDKVVFNSIDDEGLGNLIQMDLGEIEELDK